ncbi:MAG: hypothetical protein K1562_09615 [Candidatus Thiodiazotropha sp. (ex. Lucinisca nassula)]|nr:hypothetical protein [Candidatus Thiodiazotropha sp. (ex. Lucinisca nassula)]
MEEIDLRDGNADGKLVNNLKACPECGRKQKQEEKTVFGVVLTFLQVISFLKLKGPSLFELRLTENC